MEAWGAISMEAEQGFAWLCGDIDPKEPVTFVPNPGNVGDALINLSCYRYLAGRFARISICSTEDAPRTDCVFIAGGGNLVEGLYSTISDFVARRCNGRRLFFFPSSVKGFGAWLDDVASRARMVCREPVSFAHVAKHLPAENLRLGHDAAFAFAGHLRAAFVSRTSRYPSTQARLFRADAERVRELPSDGDLMARTGGSWVDLAAAEQAVIGASTTLLQFSRIYTDRLHCAILAAMLDRYVILLPNTYYKNRAVFEHSLSRFANVRFENEPLGLCAGQ
jgi:exopolysaccharide biosynthesis predicted pyruvyltransferase EpsI